MATVLIVDDRPADREFLITLLGYHRHRLLEASDGSHALALARAEHPDLVISDILMPTMDGYEFVRRLRADPVLAATPVIFYTAHYHDEEAQKLAKDCGVSYVLTKPSEPELVLQTVAQALRQSKPPTPAPTLDFDREHLRILTDKVSQQMEKLRLINERFAALNDVSLQLASERDPRRLLDSVCHAARELTAAKYALLAVGNKDRTANEFTTSGLEVETAARIGYPVWREGAVRAALQQGKALRVTNPEGDSAAVGLPLQHLPIFALLVASVVSLEHNYGWIALVDKLGAREFSEEDELLVAALGAQLGRFYENGSMYAELRRHAAKLQESELRLREREAGLHRAQLIAKLAHVITRPDGSFESWSETLPQLIGVDPAAQMPRSTREWLDILHPDDRALFRATSIQAGIECARKDVGYRLRRADGAWIHVWQVIEPLEGRAGADEGMRWFSTLQDITEQKQAENRIGRLNRVYAVLSGINALIVRVRDRDELFRDACRIAVEAGQFKLAWIGIVDREAMQVKPIAWHGAGEDYIRLMPLGLDEGMPETYGLAGRVIREGKPMVADDMVSDPRISLSEEASRHNFHSLAILPLLASGEVVAVLALYAGEVGLFDGEEIKLLLELAGDIAFALDHIAKEEKLDYLAYYDTLTGLANATLFRERVTQIVDRAAAERRKFAVVKVDIHDFKNINDLLGRQAGDELLKQLATRLGRGPRHGGTIARISADRFAAILEDIKHETDVTHELDELHDRGFATPFLIEGNEFKITAKSGVAIYPADGSDADALIRNAGVALRKAKSTGEKRVFYTQEMSQIIAERITLETRLRQALEREEFILHYQPKVDLESRQIQGVEALIRWQSPDLGLVPPLKFISVLEETGMILEAGAWALRRAVQDHRHWLAQKLMAPRVAVNVSAIQLRQLDFVDRVRGILREGANRPGIDIEITESLIMEDVAGTIDKLKMLRGLGVNIAIDDFGTGYSSLGYLAQLPVHSLKIDRSFINTMANDPNTMTLVSTIISLAHSLRLKVCAEGVETEEQAKVLRLLRCDEMQGYLISRPVPLEQLTPLLAPASA